MKKFIKIVLCFILLLSLLGINISAASDMDYTIVNGKHIYMPLCYSCDQVISYLGDIGKTFLDASDLFIDEKDNIYITDTNNNRIIMLDANGNYVKEFTNGGNLNAPKSIFVLSNGDMFIADTGNQRIVHISADDTEIESFIKPKSELLSESVDFSVNKLAISEQGIIYVVQAQQFMMIDSNNEFKGFVGANKVSSNLKEMFVRTFGSEIQKNKLVYSQAATYNSFELGKDGLIYAVANDKKNQIRILNVDGDNIFPDGQYGEQVMEDKSTNLNDAMFIDICVDENGVIHALEKNSGKIYVYSSEGDLIVTYGGIGSIRGKFSNPASIAINSKGETFVLDSAGGYIHRFNATDYMDNMLDAYSLFDRGNYDDAKSKCQEVLSINDNSNFINTLVSKIELKRENYKEAMDYAEKADDKEQFAKAFTGYRHEIFRGYLGWIVLGIAVIGLGVYLLIVFLKKCSKQVIDNYFSGGKK